MLTNLKKQLRRFRNIFTPFVKELDEILGKKLKLWKNFDWIILKTIHFPTRIAAVNIYRQGLLGRKGITWDCSDRGAKNCAAGTDGTLLWRKEKHYAVKGATLERRWKNSRNWRWWRIEEWGWWSLWNGSWEAWASNGNNEL